MAIFRKQMIRRPPMTIFLILLLAMAIGFSAIGCAAWVSAREQMASIQEIYTTMAAPVPVDYLQILEQWREGGLEKADGNIYWSDGTVTYSKENIAAVAERAPQVAQVSNSGYLSAHLRNARGLASGSLDMTQYQEAFDYFNYSFCVLAVKCVSLEDMTEEGYFDDSAEIPLYSYGQIGYTAQFEVLESLSLMDSYGDLTGKDLWISRNMVNIGGNGGWDLTEEDGSIPFEEGKTYLLRGFFRDIWMEDMWDYEAETPTRIIAPSQEEYVKRRLQFTDAPVDGQEIVYGENAEGYQEAIAVGAVPNLMVEQHEVKGMPYTYYYTTPEGSLPFWAEYTGDLDAFLESEEGRVWKETIIPWTEMNQNSAAVVLTDNLYSSYNFNTGGASILEGRDFTREEYQAGADVCLVSAAFAQHNGLALGDTVKMDYHDTGVYQGWIQTETSINSVVDYLYQRLPLTPENRIGLEKEYQIVGIYTAPEFSVGQYNFTADTIFVPKGSVPDAERYQEPMVPYLSALVLENGTQEAFEAYMTEQGMGGSYVYADMHFEDTRPALEALEANAMRLLLIGLAVFALVTGIYLYLVLRRMRPVSRSMRLMGISKRTVRRQMLSALVPLNLTSVLCGLLLGAALFGQITMAILSSTVEFTWMPVLLCGGVEAVALLLLTTLGTHGQSRMSLMQKKRRK